MEDLNLYDDLDEFQEQQDKKSKELQAIEEKYQQSQKTIGELQIENKSLIKKIQRIEVSFQSLLDTARTELIRKDKEIERLRKEKDDICFRRRIPQNETDKQRSSGGPSQQQIVKNPFKSAIRDETTTVFSNTHITEDHRIAKDTNDKETRVERSQERFTNSYKRNRSHDEDRQHKKHKNNDHDEKNRKTTNLYKSGNKNDRDPRYKDHCYEREHHQKESSNRRDNSRSHLNRGRSPDRYHNKKSLKSYESPDRNSNRLERGQNQSRDRSNANRFKSARSRDRKISSKSSESPERNSKRLERGRSRERDRSKYHHNRESERNKSRDRKKIYKNSNKSSRSPGRNEHTHHKDADHKHNEDRDYNRPHQDDYLNKKTETSQNTFDIYQDLGTQEPTIETIAEINPINKGKINENKFAKTVESSEYNKNTDISEKREKDQQKLCTDNKNEPTESENLNESKDPPNKCNLNDSSVQKQLLQVSDPKYSPLRKVDLYNKLFGASPSSSTTFTRTTSKCSAEIDSISDNNSTDLTKTKEFIHIEYKKLTKSIDNENDEHPTDNLKELPVQQKTSTSQKLSTPQKIALFDKLFGPSPSNNSYSTNTTSSCISSTKKIEVISSATTSPGDYTDISSYVEATLNNDEQIYDSNEFDKCFTKNYDGVSIEKNISSVDLTVTDDLEQIEFINIPGLDLQTPCYSKNEQTIEKCLSDKLKSAMKDNCKTYEGSASWLEKYCEQEISLVNEEVLESSLTKKSNNMLIESEKQLNHLLYDTIPGLDLISVIEEESYNVSEIEKTTLESVEMDSCGTNNIPSKSSIVDEIIEPDVNKDIATKRPSVMTKLKDEAKLRKTTIIESEIRKHNKYESLPGSDLNIQPTQASFEVSEMEKESHITEKSSELSEKHTDKEINVPNKNVKKLTKIKDLIKENVFEVEGETANENSIALENHSTADLDEQDDSNKYESHIDLKRETCIPGLDLISTLTEKATKEDENEPQIAEIHTINETAVKMSKTENIPHSDLIEKESTKEYVVVYEDDGVISNNLENSNKSANTESAKQVNLTQTVSLPGLNLISTKPQVATIDIDNEQQIFEIHTMNEMAALDSRTLANTSSIDSTGEKESLNETDIVNKETVNSNKPINIESEIQVTRTQTPSIPGLDLILTTSQITKKTLKNVSGSHSTEQESIKETSIVNDGVLAVSTDLKDLNKLTNTEIVSKPCSDLISTPPSQEVTTNQESEEQIGIIQEDVVITSIDLENSNKSNNIEIKEHSQDVNKPILDLIPTTSSQDTTHDIENEEHMKTLEVDQITAKYSKATGNASSSDLTEKESMKEIDIVDEDFMIISHELEKSNKPTLFECEKSKNNSNTITIHTTPSQETTALDFKTSINTSGIDLTGEEKSLNETDIVNKETVNSNKPINIESEIQVIGTQPSSVPCLDLILTTSQITKKTLINVFGSHSAEKESMKETSIANDGVLTASNDLKDLNKSTNTEIVSIPCSDLISTPSQDGTTNQENEEQIGGIQEDVAITSIDLENSNKSTNIELKEHSQDVNKPILDLIPTTPSQDTTQDIENKEHTKTLEVYQITAKYSKATGNASSCDLTEKESINKLDIIDEDFMIISHELEKSKKATLFECEKSKNLSNTITIHTHPSQETTALDFKTSINTSGIDLTEEEEESLNETDIVNKETVNSNKPINIESEIQVNGTQTSSIPGLDLILTTSQITKKTLKNVFGSHSIEKESIKETSIANDGVLTASNDLKDLYKSTNTEIVSIPCSDLISTPSQEGTTNKENEQIGEIQAINQTENESIIECENEDEDVVITSNDLENSNKSTCIEFKDHSQDVNKPRLDLIPTTPSQDTTQGIENEEHMKAKTTGNTSSCDSTQKESMKKIDIVDENFMIITHELEKSNKPTLFECAKSKDPSNTITVHTPSSQEANQDIEKVGQIVEIQTVDKKGKESIECIIDKDVINISNDLENSNKSNNVESDQQQDHIKSISLPSLDLISTANLETTKDNKNKVHIVDTEEIYKSNAKNSKVTKNTCHDLTANKLIKEYDIVDQDVSNKSTNIESEDHLQDNTTPILDVVSTPSQESTKDCKDKEQLMEVHSIDFHNSKTTENTFAPDLTEKESSKECTIIDEDVISKSTCIDSKKILIAAPSSQEKTKMIEIPTINEIIYENSLLEEVLKTNIDTVNPAVKQNSNDIEISKITIENEMDFAKAILIPGLELTPEISKDNGNKISVVDVANSSKGSHFSEISEKEIKNKSDIEILDVLVITNDHENSNKSSKIEYENQVKPAEAASIPGLESISVLTQETFDSSETNKEINNPISKDKFDETNFSSEYPNNKATSSVTKPCSSVVSETLQSQKEIEVPGLDLILYMANETYIESKIDKETTSSNITMESVEQTSGVLKTVTATEEAVTSLPIANSNSKIESMVSPIEIQNKMNDNLNKDLKELQTYKETNEKLVENGESDKNLINSSAVKKISLDIKDLTTIDNPKAMSKNQETNEENNALTNSLKTSFEQSTVENVNLNVNAGEKTASCSKEATNKYYSSNENNSRESIDKDSDLNTLEATNVTNNCHNKLECASNITSKQNKVLEMSFLKEPENLINESQTGQEITFNKSKSLKSPNEDSKLGSLQACKELNESQNTLEISATKSSKQNEIPKETNSSNKDLQSVKEESGQCLSNQIMFLKPQHIANFYNLELTPNSIISPQVKENLPKQQNVKEIQAHNISESSIDKILVSNMVSVNKTVETASASSLSEIQQEQVNAKELSECNNKKLEIQIIEKDLKTKRRDISKDKEILSTGFFTDVKETPFRLTKSLDAELNTPNENVSLSSSHLKEPSVNTNSPKIEIERSSFNKLDKPKEKSKVQQKSPIKINVIQNQRNSKHKDVEETAKNLTSLNPEKVGNKQNLRNRITNKLTPNENVKNQNEDKEVFEKLQHCQNEVQKVGTRKDNNKDLIETEYDSNKMVIQKPKEIWKIKSSQYSKLSADIQYTYNAPSILPSIPTNSPTPSNFSGIFSKKPLQVAGEDDIIKFKKRSSHFNNTKPREYIIPAASVLCNVDNIENATKPNKKLHWELLENKHEMTEIEDDTDVDNTDEERKGSTHLQEPQPKLIPYKCTESLTSESETQSEDELRYRSLSSLNLDTNKQKPLEQRRTTIDTVPITHAVSYYKQLEALEQKKQRAAEKLKKKAVKKQLNFVISKVKKHKKRKLQMSKSVTAKLRSAIDIGVSNESFSSGFAKDNVIKKRKISFILPKNPRGRPRKLENLEKASKCYNKAKKSINKETPKIVRELKKRGRPKKKCENEESNLDICTEQQKLKEKDDEINENTEEKQKRKAELQLENGDQQIKNKRPQQGEKCDKTIENYCENSTVSEINKQPDVNKENYKDNEEKLTIQLTESKEQLQKEQADKILKINKKFLDHQIYQEFLSNCSKPVEDRTKPNVDDMAHDETSSDNSEIAYSQESVIQNKQFYSNRLTTSNSAKQTSPVKSSQQHSVTKYGCEMNKEIPKVIGKREQHKENKEQNTENEDPQPRENNCENVKNIISKDPVEQMKSSETQNQDYEMENSQNTSIINHKDDSIEDHNSSIAENSEPECNKYLIDEEVPTTSKASKTPEESIVNNKILNLRDKDLPATSKESKVLENHCMQNKTTKEEIQNKKESKLLKEVKSKEIDEAKQIGKSKTLIKSNTSIRKINVKNVNTTEALAANKKKIVSLEEIGIKVRTFKGHLSSFRIPKINKDLEVTNDKSWKLETYSEVSKEIKHTNQYNEIENSKDRDREKHVSLKEKKGDKKLNYHKEKSDEHVKEKILSLKEKKYEDKMLYQPKGDLADNTEEKIRYLKDNKEQKNLHPYKEKGAKSLKDDTRNGESKTMEANRCSQHSEDNNKKTKQFSHQIADISQQVEISHDKYIMKEPMKKRRQSLNIPRNSTETSLDILKDIKEHRIISSKEDTNQKNCNNNNKDKVEISKEKTNSAAHKRKLFSSELNDHDFVENLECNDPDTAKSSGKKYNNNNCDVNYTKNVNENLHEIVLERSNKNTISNSNKDNNTEYYKEDTKYQNSKKSTTLKSRRKSTNLERKNRDTNSEEDATKEEHCRFIKNECAAKEIQAICTKEIYNSDNSCISKDNNQQSNIEGNHCHVTQKKISLKPRRKSLNLHRRILDTSSDEDTKNKPIKTSHINEVINYERETSTPSLTSTATRRKSINLQRRILDSSCDEDNENGIAGKNPSNAIKSQQQIQKSVINENSEDTNQHEKTIKSIRMLKNSTNGEQKSLNAATKQCLEPQISPSQLEVVDRKKREHEPENILDKNQLLDNHSKKDRKENKQPLKPIRRKSMYQDTVTSETQENDNQHQEPQCTRDQQDVLNTKPKPITSLKMRRKSIYQDKDTTNIQQECKKIDNNQHLEPHSSLDTNQLKVINSNNERENRNPPPKTITSARIRRKSMYQENDTSNILQEEGEVYNRQQHKPQSNSGNLNNEAENPNPAPKIITSLKMRRKSIHQDRDTLKIHQEVKEIDNNPLLEPQGSLAKNLLEVINSNTESESANPPLKIITSARMRRKSMYQERLTSNIQNEGNDMDNNQHSQQQNSSDKTQLEVINSINKTENATISPKPIKSIKIRRKSMFQERVTLNDQQEGNEMGNNQQSLQQNQLEVSNFHRDIRDTNPPPVKMRRKSMYQEIPQQERMKNEELKLNPVRNIENPKTSLEIKDIEKNTLLETEQNKQAFTLDKSRKIVNLVTNQKIQHQLSTGLNHNTGAHDLDVSGVLTHEPTIQTQTVIQNEEKTPLTTVKSRPRKRRVVKVLSNSRDEPPSVKILQTPEDITQNFATSPPLISPTLNHSIFNTEVIQQQTDITAILPPTPNKQYDDKFKEIDSKLNEIFQSPQDMTDFKTTQTLNTSNMSIIPAVLNDSKPNITIEETIVCNQDNNQTSLNLSKHHDLTDSLSLDQSEIKHLSLGSSEYRFEKVSDNVVNLFISRKRKRKRTN